jgi:hypothetical protein
VAAWVRCDTTGGGGFPRIVDTPSYRVFFRFASSDVNSVGFATYDSTGGDFDSGGGTISLGTWYHVAASFDRSNLANRPTFYVNGTRLTTTTLTAPSGTPPSLSGTGYIGNNSALTRNWDGLLDDLRIYDRLLSDIEVQTLAAAPPVNLAPVVSAGTNQIVVWPGFANLNGSVTDDGNPNPPGVVMVTWSQTSGPSTVVFGNSNAPSTTASFPTTGNYVLQLAANDGQAQTVSSVDIDVIAGPAIAFQLLPGVLHLSWPATIGNWRLQSQTNSLALGLSTNWADVSGSLGTNEMDFPINPANPAVFYRLVFP